MIPVLFYGQFGISVSSILLLNDFLSDVEFNIRRIVLERFDWLLGFVCFNANAHLLFSTVLRVALSCWSYLLLFVIPLDCTWMFFT